MNILWTGTLISAQQTSGAATTSTNNLWLAQSFITGASQTAVGYVIVPLTTTSTSSSTLAPTTISIYANSAGAPTGAALVSTTVTAEYANKASGGTTTTFVQYMLPVSGLSTATTYWIVVHSTASSGFFTWERSNQVSGASTSTNGTAWTAQGYGFEYGIFDASASGQVQGTWEDSGARWTSMTYNALNQLSTIAEYTVDQNSTYQQSFRTLTYTTGFLTGVA